MTDQPDVKCPECDYPAMLHPLPNLANCTLSEVQVLRAALSASEAALAEAQERITDLMESREWYRKKELTALRERDEARAEVEQANKTATRIESYLVEIDKMLPADVVAKIPSVEGQPTVVGVRLLCAEVERLTLALQDEDKVCDALTVTCKSCDGAGSFGDSIGCHDCVGRGYTVRDVFADIAAERQQIVAAIDAAVDDAFTTYPIGRINRLMPQLNEIRDRIASGYYAPERQEVRDGE